MHHVFASASRFADSSDRNLSIVWIEDIDRLCSKRTEYDQENTQLVSQLLTCIDGLRVSHRVLVLATTTRPFALDDALRRAEESASGAMGELHAARARFRGASGVGDASRPVNNPAPAEPERPAGDGDVE